MCSIASYINEIFYLVVRKQDCALNQLEVDVNEKVEVQRQIDAMDKGMDGLFDDLLDTHILKHEKNQIVPLINILANPNDLAFSEEGHYIKEIG